MALQILVLVLSLFPQKNVEGDVPSKSLSQWLGSGVLSFLEFNMKFSFSIVYVIAVMNVCMASVHFALGGSYGTQQEEKTDF